MVKLLFLLNGWIIFNESRYVALVTLAYHTYINHDTRLTLIHLTARSNMVTKAFQWKNVETLDFQACDLKIGRYREFFQRDKICEYSRSNLLFNLTNMTIASKTNVM